MRTKERYRLEALLKVKARNKRESERELGQSIKAQKEEEEKLEELKRQKEEIIEKRENSRKDMALKVASGEASIAESRGHLHYIQRLQEDEEQKEEQIEEQKEEVKNAESRVQQAKRDYIDAARQLQVMEKHKELWKKKIAQKLNKLEAKQMNELGNVLHQLKQAQF